MYGVPCLLLVLFSAIMSLFVLFVSIHVLKLVENYYYFVFYETTMGGSPGDVGEAKEGL